MEIDPEELPKLTSSLEENRVDAIVRFNGHRLKVKVSQDQIDFLTEDKHSSCINLVIEPDSIYLDSYYFYTEMEKCPHVPHAVFFSFLKRLTQIYNRPATLVDLSRKSLDHTYCEIRATVFSLAGYPTFYERFGFKNDQYKETIRQLQPLPLGDLLALQKRRQSRRINPNVKKIEKYLQKVGMNWSTPVKTLAQFLVRSCKQAHAHNKEFSRRASMARTRKFARSMDSKTLGVLLDWLGFDVLRNLKQDMPYLFTLQPRP
jgi:hypothetical protein